VSAYTRTKSSKVEAFKTTDHLNREHDLASLNGLMQLFKNTQFKKYSKRSYSKNAKYIDIDFSDAQDYS